MTGHSTLATPLLHRGRRASHRIDEALLLRVIVQRNVLHSALLRMIDVERAGSGTTLSLLDWLVVRGHLSEETLTAVVAACMASQRLTAPTRTRVTQQRRHLRLVSSRSHPCSDVSPRDAAPSDRRHHPLPHLLRRLA